MCQCESATGEMGTKFTHFFSSNNFVFKIQHIWRNQMIDFVKTNKVNELKDKWQSAHGMPSDFLSPTRFGRSFQHLCLNFLNTLCLQKDVNRTLSSVFFFISFALVWTAQMHIGTYSFGRFQNISVHCCEHTNSVYVLNERHTGVIVCVV